MVRISMPCCHPAITDHSQKLTIPGPHPIQHIMVTGPAEHTGARYKRGCNKLYRLRQQSEDPFFLYLAFNAPHDSRQSLKVPRPLSTRGHTTARKLVT